MYKVCFILKDKRQFTIMNTDNQPAIFESEEAGWAYIQSVMRQSEHPALMWLVKVGETYAVQ